jgi:hypothetical protein
MVRICFAQSLSLLWEEFEKLTQDQQIYVEDLVNSERFVAILLCLKD